MPYDWDVTVIGAGPAGLAAAIRVRWLKRHFCVPCSVIICDPAGIGGLMQLGSTTITGPSWSKTAKDMIDPFLRDIENFQIPIEREEVITVEREKGTKGLLLVKSRSGKSWRSLAVIISTGMKRLSNEAEFFGHGIEVTCMSYQYVQNRIKELFMSDDNFPLIFVGSGKLINLIPFVESFRDKKHEVLYIIEGNSPYLESAIQLVNKRVIEGRVQGYEGNGRLQSVRVNGTSIECAHLIIDFNSYELYPDLTVNITPAVSKTEVGFISVDRSMSTSVHGFFSAGDITGMPASVTKSLGEGVIAGFSAYTYVYKQKFGQKPSLFAYFADDRLLDENHKDIPDDINNHPPVPLVSHNLLIPVIKQQIGGDACYDVMAALCEHNIDRFKDACGSKTIAAELLETLIRNKFVTVHAKD